MWCRRPSWSSEISSENILGSALGTLGGWYDLTSRLVALLIGEAKNVLSELTAGWGVDPRLII